VEDPFGKKGGKVYDLKTNEIIISWDVIFHETIVPFSKYHIRQQEEQ